MKAWEAAGLRVCRACQREAEVVKWDGILGVKSQILAIFVGLRFIVFHGSQLMNWRLRASVVVEVANQAEGLSHLLVALKLTNQLERTCFGFSNFGFLIKKAVR